MFNRITEIKSLPINLKNTNEIKTVKILVGSETGKILESKKFKNDFNDIFYEVIINNQKHIYSEKQVGVLTDGV